ncbi:MAG: C-terminal binding protein [Caldilineaceae bacterium]|nr:C-terminal binding protein [Caldilineaceae bacterium]
MSFRVLVTDYAWPNLEIERALLAEVGAELVVAPNGTAEEILALAGDVDAILTCWKQVPPGALDVASRCRIVSRYGIGLDNIPVARATDLGIVVSNVPDFCLDEVAEHTLALLMACGRRVVPLADATRRGEWTQALARGMPRLRGQVLGLVGYGNIAQAVAERARALGLQVMAYTPRLAPDALNPWGRATNDLSELLAAADYVSLHLPLTPETRGLFNGETLAMMKPSAYLINTSRGAIIDEAALSAALESGQIAGAALDVMSSEPPPLDHPLLAHPHVIATPHVAFYSEAAIVDLATKAARQVVQALRGEVPANVVNPAVLAQENCRLVRG